MAPATTTSPNGAEARTGHGSPAPSPTERPPRAQKLLPTLEQERNRSLDRFREQVAPLFARAGRDGARARGRRERGQAKSAREYRQTQHVKRVADENDISGA